MRKQLFTILSHVEKAVDNDRFIVVRGMASTSDVDRGGDIIAAEAWTKGGLDNFNKNPIILFQHDGNRPIGRCTDIKVVDKGLEITAKISKSNPVATLVEEGIITAFSVGARIKEADYIKETGGLLITDAELYEVSLVSIPANQNALFSVVKSFSETEFDTYKSNLPGEDELTGKPEVIMTKEGKSKMDKDEILKLLQDSLTAFKNTEAEEARKAAEKADKEAKAALEAKKAAEDAVAAAVTSFSDRTDKLIKEAVEAAQTENKTAIEALSNDLKEKAAEIAAFTNSKRSFEAEQTKNWEKAAEPMLRDAYVLGAILGKNWTSTKLGKDVVEKVNAMSGVGVSAVETAVYETIVSTSIERDIEHSLRLAPLFREVAMNAATMVLPIQPDAGYAEFIATKKLTNTGDTDPHGNLTQRGDVEGSPYGGIDLGSKILSTKKLFSLTFLANETEEDSIMPVMAIIQESMVRAHARAVERAILRGSSSIGSFDGLVTIAAANSSLQTSGVALASESLTAQDLLNMRKAMGKYGVEARDVIYVVNETEYFNLLDDPEFKDANLVGEANATKLTGQVGRLYNSPVILCDEFEAKAASKVHAVAVNTRNFLVPRLRGITLENQYIPRAQHLELVATQRLGFDQLIDGAKAVISRRYAAA